jgi:hypothetical protein
VIPGLWTAINCNEINRYPRLLSDNEVIGIPWSHSHDMTLKEEGTRKPLKVSMLIFKNLVTRSSSAASASQVWHRSHPFLSKYMILLFCSVMTVGGRFSGFYFRNCYSIRRAFLYLKLFVQVGDSVCDNRQCFRVLLPSKSRHTGYKSLAPHVPTFLSWSHPPTSHYTTFALIAKLFPTFHW